MKKLLNRAKHVVGGEEGASNIEIVVWIVVVLVIAVALFAFRDQIGAFLGTAKDSVGDMDDAINDTRSSIDW
ncbi:hypothetical protein [Caldibacillus debilis]|uniref:Uncharacterized protein n=1 Tax=Caldibacillus debilis GB1 TaxID=1339248 RepID=A0A420VDY4_9BACI|nr:hypothetical protein [Caldibacillus debilis]RKO61861.1 hypothetical protein Cdeb_01356 [Caldibacillus debilis GB1]